MSKPKYLQQYETMLENNLELFNKLKEYDRNSDDFKEIQMKVLRIVSKNQDVLCKKTESTKFSNFSLGLADKFIELVRADYPEIDFS